MQNTFWRFRRPPVRTALRALRQKLRLTRSVETPQPDQILPGGMEKIEAYFNKRENPYRHARKVIPDIQLDLAALKLRKLPEPEQAIRKRHTNDARQKYQFLCHTFAGESELLALHALLCAFLRRRGCHPRYRKLFFRMWREEGDFLAANLSTRWLISAATTFADYGVNTEQRIAGQSFALVFDLIKLHDSERRLSGRPNHRPFRPNALKIQDPLAFDLPPYTYAGGDLDDAILYRLNKMAKSDPLIEPLGHALMSRLIGDHRSIFARTQKLKAPQTKKKRAELNRN